MARGVPTAPGFAPPDPPSGRLPWKRAMDSCWNLGVRASNRVTMVERPDSAIAGDALDRVTTGRGVGPRLANAKTAWFRTLVAQHQEPIRRLVYRLLAWSHEAEDVVQEVFLVALEKLASFRGESSPATWLTRIAINKCGEHRRKVSVRLRALTEPGAWAARRTSNPSAAAQAIDRETAQRVRKAVGALPQKYREAVVLRCLQGLTARQTGELLEISPGAVDTRLQRARAMLKETLADLVED